MSSHVEVGAQIATKVCSTTEGKIECLPTSHCQNTANGACFAGKKIMCANRGEIAIRVFRAAVELNLRTVAIFSFEDRYSQHRCKADEAYQIGQKGQFSPVGAYLAIDEIIAIAKEHQVDMIHPGYGFLSENAEFAEKCERAGMMFVGPQADVIRTLGDKTAARQLAEACGVPIVPGTKDPVENLEEARLFATLHGYPIIIKATLGGGGRGMRVVTQESALEESFMRCRSEALASFGNASVFLEKFIEGARHIEVQFLGDHYGHMIHLYERDCSVQRRHQKVVEMAPSLHLPLSTKQALYSDTLTLAKAVHYTCAGTAEFLVDASNRYYFIEINPRIQVEHTVTEEITGVDLVASQIKVTLGCQLAQLGLFQDSIPKLGHAIQCRITTEDPLKHFQPDCGRIELYRSPGGFGLRLDGSAGFTGSVITPFYDSLLVKVTGKGATYGETITRLQRALAEFRIRGVKTNISFIRNLLAHPTFQAAQCTTTFIDDHPELFVLHPSQNRAQKLLFYLADMIVNGSHIEGQRGLPIPVSPHIPPFSQPCQEGWRSVFLQHGPHVFCQKIMEASKTQCFITDTTWRDAHQSLLMTRVRTRDLAAIATATSHLFRGAFSLEMWGGATFDVSLRFLYECPWERLRTLRKLCPNIPFQMLLRGANAVGYSNYPDHLIVAFVRKAKEEGIDIFRVFDALNYLPNLQVGVDAVKAAGGIVEGTLCYTGHLSDPHTKYTLDYYLSLAAALVKMGIHILGIKDMAGVLRPRAAEILIGRLRETYPSLPIHLHTHDTAGTGVATVLAAEKAGVTIIDCALDALSGATSQPSMGAVMNSLEKRVAIAFDDMLTLNTYWEQMRLLYGCFEGGLTCPASEVYHHEMPGGQYTNLQFQAMSLGLGEQWSTIKQAYVEANRICGDIIKVTPTSKVVGDLAQFMVQNHLREADVYQRADSLNFPSSVIEFFQGLLGQPYGGFQEALRSAIVKQRPRYSKRPGAELPAVDLEQLKHRLTMKYPALAISECDVLSAAMYPAVFDDYCQAQEKYGQLTVLPTYYFLAPLQPNEEISVELETGKLLFLRYITCAPCNADNHREVFFELNGEARSVMVEDHKASLVRTNVVRHKANPTVLGEVGAPMSGMVVQLKCAEGDTISTGGVICILNAMKMEMAVTSPVTGKIEALFVRPEMAVQAGDLVARIQERPVV